MGNIFKKQKPSKIMMPTDLIPVNGIQKYVRIRIEILGKYILIHGFGRNYIRHFYTENKEGDISFDFIELIEKTIFSNRIEVDIFFENTKPITRDNYHNSTDSISVVESLNNSRFHEVNESYEIFKKNNYNWRFELFEAIRTGTDSDFKICFTNYIYSIKHFINDNDVYSGLKNLQKKMYNTILSFNADYPTKEELQWIFDPVATICFIANLYKLSFYTYKSSKNNPVIKVQNIIIISKNLDQRIQALIYFFGGKIDYSYSNNSLKTPVVPVPIIKIKEDYILPYITDII